MEITVMHLEICQHQLLFDGGKYCLLAPLLPLPVNSICNHQSAIDANKFSNSIQLSLNSSINSVSCTLM